MKNLWHIEVSFEWLIVNPLDLNGSWLINGVILNVAVRHLSAVFDVLHRSECECCMVGLTDYEASK